MSLESAILIIFAALWGGGLTWYGLACVLYPLHAAGTRLPLMIAVAVVIAAGPVVTALAALRMLPSLLFAVIPGLLLLVVGACAPHCMDGRQARGCVPA